MLDHGQVYKTRVVSKGLTWMVYRRYRNFYNLDQKLRKKFALRLSLPKKKLLGNLKTEFIEGRRVALHVYMQQLLRVPDVQNSPELTAFLAPDQAGDVEGTVAEEEIGNETGGRAAFTLDDFHLMKVIGKGSFGKVVLARGKADQQVYAIKILDKKAIVKKGELEHVKSERNVLIATTHHPFLVTLHCSFQSPDKLYFVLNYVNGGELFYHLQRDKRFPETRARFYAGEIALALGHLHSVGIVYRDLKPENILIAADGHIILTDFGLCKEGITAVDTTTTFCGTPEYLSPEVLRNEPHGFPVDWWSFGIVLYEMISGLPPFYSENRELMYERTLSEDLNFSLAFSAPAKEMIKLLLVRDPALRLGTGEDDVEAIKAQPFFAAIEWDALYRKEITPPWIPQVRSEEDTGYIDAEFLREPVTQAGVAAKLPDSVNAQFSGFTFSGDASAVAAAAAHEDDDDD